MMTQDVPSDVTVLITSSVLTLTALGLVVHNDSPVKSYTVGGNV